MTDVIERTLFRRMSIDDYARWLSRVTLAIAIITIVWGSSVVLGQPVTAWFATSATIWMALLLVSAFWQLRGSFTAIAAFALATGVVSRLFSILRLNPPASIAGLNHQDLDLLVATGPGVPGFELLGWFLGALSPYRRHHFSRRVRRLTLADPAQSGSVDFAYCCSPPVNDQRCLLPLRAFRATAR
jgi:hypothetical protein